LKINFQPLESALCWDLGRVSVKSLFYFFGGGRNQKNRIFKKRQGKSEKVYRYFCTSFSRLSFFW